MPDARGNVTDVSTGKYEWIFSVNSVNTHLTPDLQSADDNMKDEDKLGGQNAEMCSRRRRLNCKS